MWPRRPPPPAAPGRPTAAGPRCACRAGARRPPPRKDIAASSIGVDAARSVASTTSPPVTASRNPARSRSSWRSCTSGSAVDRPDLGHQQRRRHEQRHQQHRLRAVVPQAVPHRAADRGEGQRGDRDGQTDPAQRRASQPAQHPAYRRPRQGVARIVVASVHPPAGGRVAQHEHDPDSENVGRQQRYLQRLHQDGQ